MAGSGHGTWELQHVFLDEEDPRLPSLVPSGVMANMETEKEGCADRSAPPSQNHRHLTLRDREIDFYLI